MPLALARQRRRIYETNPIKLVVCQVRFPVLAAFERADFVEPVERGLSESYPRKTQDQQLGVTFGPHGAVQQPPSAIWRFRELDGPWTITLARDFLSLETGEYERFEDLQERLAEALDTLTGIGVTVRERLGLRYVNQLSHPDAQRVTDWPRFIRADLLGVAGGPELGDDVTQAIQQIRLKEPDCGVAISHGYLSDEVAGGDGTHYLIDIDFFEDRAAKLEIDDVLSSVDRHHQRLKDLFEMSITDEMRQHLVIKEELDD